MEVGEGEPSNPEGLLKKFQAEAGSERPVDETIDEETELDVVNKVI